MQIDLGKLVSAGRVVPDGKVPYVVVLCDGHPTLQRGDQVRMLETPPPGRENVLLRVTDLTLHALMAGEAYVVLAEA